MPLSINQQTVFTLEVQEFSLFVLKWPLLINLNIIQLESYFNMSSCCVKYKN